MCCARGKTCQNRARDIIIWRPCAALIQILCRIRPYHEIGELQVAEYIKNGHPPSDRPRGPRASLINDPLWATLSSCWQAQDWRPTSRVFLERLMEMLQNGELSTSPVLSELFPIIGNSGGPMALDKWPDELDDLRDQLEVEWSIGPIASSVRSKVWLLVLFLPFYSMPVSYIHTILPQSGHS